MERTKINKLRVNLHLLLMIPIMLPFSGGICNLSANDQIATLPPYHPFKSVKAQVEYLAYNDMRSKKWPIVSETKMVETSFGKTFVRMSGPVDAPPLVLLPGLGANSLMWGANIKAFSEHFRVYALDNIYDFGRSIYIRPLKSSDEFSQWIDELPTALKLGNNVDIIGMSYGSWLVSQFALRYPGRLKKMVLLAPAAAILPVRMEYMIRTLFMLVHPHFIKSFFYWVFKDLANKDENSRKQLDEIIEETILSIRCFKPIKLVPPTVLKDQELHNLQIPTLFVVGEHDKVCSAKKAVERLNRVAPQIKTAIIPGGGHDLTIVQTDLVNTIVLDFLKP